MYLRSISKSLIMLSSLLLIQHRGTAQANTTLSNLATTAVNADLVPSAANTRNLGASSKTWKNLYFGGALYAGGNRFISFTSSSGLNNTAIGISSLISNTTGYGNTGIGASTLHSNTTGFNNVAVGYGSLFYSVTGHNNVAVGTLTLYKNSGGVSNSAMGNSALTNNTTGNNNMAIGANALGNNTSGEGNVGIGVRALFRNTVGGHNVAIGDSAAFNQYTEDGETVAIGWKALYSSGIGSYNVAIGSAALFSNDGGYANTATGYHALEQNVDGAYNVADGESALKANRGGIGNTAIGSEALLSNTTGEANTATGHNALYQNTTGAYNTAFGADALLSNDGATSSFNTALGFAALESTKNSQYNTAVGWYAGGLLDAGYNNTFLGANSDISAAGLFNVVALGEGAICNQNSQARIGNSATGSIGGYVNWTNISDGRFKKNVKADVSGMAFIRRLRPVTYTLDVSGLERHLNSGRKPPAGQNRVKENAISEKEKTVWSGFVAQDVEKAASEAGYTFSGVDKPNDDKGLYGLRYAEFVVPLVKAVQELDDSLGREKKKNDSLVTRVDSLESRLARIEAMLHPGTAFGVSLSDASLQQNSPNPVSGTTTIQYVLPQKYGRAKILVADVSGRVMKEFSLSGSGKGTLQIQATGLSAGTYPYALYVDGAIIGVKQMLVIH